MRLLRGEARLGPPFDRLAAAVEATWGVRVVNVVHDRSLHGRPRLQVLVWDEDEAGSSRSLPAGRYRCIGYRVRKDKDGVAGGAPIHTDA